MDSVGTSEVPAERACAHHSQPASVLHTHQSLRTLKRSHVERNCNLPTMGPDLFAFTSLSKLLVCEVVGVIKFGGGKERPFKGSLIGKRAVSEELLFFIPPSPRLQSNLRCAKRGSRSYLKSFLFVPLLKHLSSSPPSSDTKQYLK